MQFNPIQAVNSQAVPSSTFNVTINPDGSIAQPVPNGDTRVARGGSHIDAESNDRKIFVGGLSYEVDSEKLKDFFSRTYGAVDSAEVMKDRTTNMSRGFGFVIFEDMAIVDKVVGDSPLDCMGNKVDIRKAQPKGLSTPAVPTAPKPIQKNFNGASANLQGKIFIGGLEGEITKERISNYFSKFGPVKGVDLMENKQTGQLRGFCFLTFENPDDANHCVGRHPNLNRSCEAKLAVARPQKNTQIPSTQAMNPPSFPQQAYNDSLRFMEEPVKKDNVVQEQPLKLDHLFRRTPSEVKYLNFPNNASKLGLVLTPYNPNYYIKEVCTPISPEEAEEEPAKREKREPPISTEERKTKIVKSATDDNESPSQDTKENI